MYTLVYTLIYFIHSFLLKVLPSDYVFINVVRLEGASVFALTKQTVITEPQLPQEEVQFD